MHEKLFSDSILILVNKIKQQLQAENSLNTRYLERGLSESLKNLTLFFLLSPVLFNGQDYEKQKGLELMTNRFSGYEANPEKFLY